MTWSAVNLKNTWPQRAQHLSPLYGHAIPISGYFVLTAVNEHKMDLPCQIAKMHKLPQVDLFIFFGHHLARPCRLSSEATCVPAVWPCDTGQRVYCFDSCQLTRIFNVIKLMWTFLFTKPGWLRSPCLRDSAVVGDKSHPWPVPLAMLTMKMETLGF